MLVREGDQRNQSVNVRLAIALSAAAGALNSAIFQAFGLFSANMTGNASSLSDQLALGEFGAGTVPAMIIATFIFGAFVAVTIIERVKSRLRKRTYASMVAVEGVFLILVAFLYNAPGIGTVLAVAFFMGWQNAISTRISNARVRTTHISGIATDIGIAIALLVRQKRLSSVDSDLMSRFHLSMATLLSFVIGGIFGVLVYDRIGFGVFIAVGSALLSMALFEAAKVGGVAPGPDQ